MNQPDAPPSAPPGIHQLPVGDCGFRGPLRICFSVSHFLGFPEPMGIGCSNAAFAGALAKAGHEVTVLVTSPLLGNEHRMYELEADAKALGVILVFLPELPFPCWIGRQRSPQALIAYRTWFWLKDKSFDVIHFNDYQTSGFFCVSSKRAGLGFQNTLLCVLLCNPSRWLREGDESLITCYQMLESDFFEQRTTELADLVIVPNLYIAQWVADKGWNLPKRLYHQPNLVNLPDSLIPKTKPETASIKEIVFFGRLQPRKGLIEFCDAIDNLEASVLKTIRLTFLGSHVAEPVDSRSFLAEKFKKWRADAKVLENLSHEASLAYLQNPGVLAVFPSRSESLGNSLYDCMLMGIPFLASKEGAIPELVCDEDHDEVLFQLTAEDLAQKLAEAIIEPPRVGRPRSLPVDSEKQWVEWHNGLYGSDDLQKKDQLPPSVLPRVTVCLVHFNQPVLVFKAIESLEAQTYPNFEVILVDNGSTLPSVETALLEIEARFATRGWRVLRQGRLAPGAARNHAAREAQGEYLMFMDDDNVAMPHEIETFVKAAICSAQDVVVCTNDSFEGLGDPTPADTDGHVRQIFLGGPPTAGFFENTFGDTNFFIRKSVYHAVGGFSELKNVAVEDWHLLAALAIAGYQILMIPQPLFYYRIRPDSNYRTSTAAQREKLMLTLFDHLVTPTIKDILVYGFSLDKRTLTRTTQDPHLAHYLTVIDASAKSLGVVASWGPGWFDDEKLQIWSGGELSTAVILLEAVAPCVIDFSANVLPAQPGNALRIMLNDRILLNDFHDGTLRLEAISLQKGVNTLSFEPQLPPEMVVPGDSRKLSYLFNRISISPTTETRDSRTEPDILPTVENPNRTVLINHLHRIGATAAFAEGWHDDEKTHRWAGRTGNHSSLTFQSPVEQQILFRADVSWFSTGDSLNAHFGENTICFDPEASHISLSLPLKPDVSNVLSFDTKLPPLSPGPEDSRLLSFCLSNIQITLEPFPPPLQTGEGDTSISES